MKTPIADRQTTKDRQFKRIDHRFVRLIPNNEYPDSLVLKCPIKGFASKDGFYIYDPNGVQGWDVTQLG